MVAVSVLLILVVALAFRWEKISTSRDLDKITYLRDRWLGQTYVQSWGGAAYGGDGKGTAIPTFSDAQLNAYRDSHLTDEEMARGARYLIVTGKIDDRNLAEETKALLTRYGYSTSRWDFTRPAIPDEEQTLLAKMIETDERHREELKKRAYQQRDAATAAWALLMIGAVAAMVYKPRGPRTTHEEQRASAHWSER
jgi:hypothetical protein